MKIITEQDVSKLLSSFSTFTNLKTISEGSNHFVFRMNLTSLDGKKLKKEIPTIMKFAKTRETEGGITPPHLDTLFGGHLSLQRESYLFTSIKEQTAMPTPKVYKIGSSSIGEYLLIEAMPGEEWRDYLAHTGYKKALYLHTLECLGADFAVIQKMHYPSFGNIMDKGIIEPAGKTNFVDRWNSIIEMRINHAVKKGAFSSDEADNIEYFFTSTLEGFRTQLESTIATPVMVFTDMHAGNFFVDGNGKPSGYFDLESAQAAPAALEFYGFKFFLFNLFDKETMNEAEDAFWKGYKENNGEFAPKSKKDEEFIDFLSACRLLELTNSYWGVYDGIRDTWAPRMKEMLFSYMRGKDIDYIEIGNIWRMRDKQPLLPNS